MLPYSIGELKRIISPIAEQHGVKSVSLFGSYSKGTATAGSDVDLKIEKGKLRSLFQLRDRITSESSDIEFLDMIKKEEVLLYQNA